MLLCPKSKRLERSVKEDIVILDPKGQDMKAFEIEIEWNSIIRDVALLYSQGGVTSKRIYTN